MSVSTPGLVDQAIEDLRRGLIQAEGYALETLANLMRPGLRVLLDLEQAIIDAHDAAQREGRLLRPEDLAALDTIRGIIREYEGLLRTAADLAQQAIARQQAALAVATQEQLVAIARLTDPTVGGLAWVEPRRIAAMAGLLAPGAPLRQRIDTLPVLVGNRLLDGLMAAAALPLHPREIARRALGRAQGVALAKLHQYATDALAFAQHETTRQWFKANSDLVSGWQWRAARQPGRTCLACLGMDGRIFGVDQRLPRHSRCRCVMVPVLVGQLARGRLEPVEDWYANLPLPQKRAWGPGVYHFLTHGGRFSDFVLQVRDPDFGLVVREGSLERARQAAIAAGRGDPLATYRRPSLVRPRRPAPAPAAPKAPAAKPTPAPATDWVSQAQAIIAKGYNSWKDAVAVGELILDQYLAQLPAGLNPLWKLGKQHYKALKEFNEISLKLANPAPNMDALPLWQRLKALGKRLTDQDAKLAALWAKPETQAAVREAQDRLAALLRQVRPDFGTGTDDLNFESPYTVPPRWAQLLNDNRRLYPKAWWDRMVNGGDLAVNILAGRGHFAPNVRHTVGPGPPTHEIALGQDWQEAVATHELWHFAQTVTPALRDLEKDFYRYRTAGEPLQSRSPYLLSERVRPDRFIDPYQGRHYPRAAKAHEGVEMNSTMASYIWWPQRHGIHPTTDREHAAFLLGLLAGVP